MSLLCNGGTIEPSKRKILRLDDCSSTFEKGSGRLLYEFYGLWNRCGKQSLRKSNCNYLKWHAWIPGSIRLVVSVWTASYWLEGTSKEVNKYAKIAFG